MRKLLSLLILLLVFPAQAKAGSNSYAFSINGNNTNTASTVYTSAYGGTFGWQATQTTAQQLVSAPGTYRNLYVYTGVAPGVGKSYDITLFKNNAATTVTCQISGTNKSCTDLTNSVAYVAADSIGMRVTPTGTPAATRMGWQLRFESTTDKESNWPGNGGAFVNNATSWTSIGGQMDDTTTETNHTTIVPAAGTIKNLYVKMQGTAGTGNTNTFTVRKNEADQTVTCAISGNVATTCNDTTHSFTVVAGDRITLQDVPNSLPTSQLTSFGLTFVANTEGQYIATVANSAGGGNPSTSATTYGGMMAGDMVWSAAVNEVDKSIMTDLITLGALYVNDLTAPGGAASYVYTLRKNFADTALTVTVSGANTTGNLTTDVILSSTDLIDLSVVPASTPAATNTRYSFMGHKPNRSRPRLVDLGES